MNVFISQPMRVKAESEIVGERKAIVEKIAKIIKTDYLIMNSYFEDYAPDKGCVPLKYLAKSLEMLADADVAFFAKGWENAKGCRIEHDCAKAYGIMIIEE